jgi:hypothetical protein
MAEDKREHSGTAEDKRDLFQCIIGSILSGDQDNCFRLLRIDASVSNRILDFTSAILRQLKNQLRLCRSPFPGK